MARVPEFGWVPFAIASLAPGCLSAGCGGAPAPAAEAAHSAAATRPAPPDLTAVPVPGGLVVQVTLTRPAASIRTALGWARLPPSRAGEIDRALAGDEIGAVADLDQPLDFALINGGHGLVPVWAGSAAVRSLESARAGLSSHFTLTARAGGVFAVEPVDDADKTKRACIVAPSAGASPFRLVCGSSEEALGYLAPYLTRTAPRKAHASDVHVELRTDPIKPFARMMRMQAPALLDSLLDLRRSEAPELADLVEGVVGDLVDFVGDLGKTEIDLALDDEGANATFHAGFVAKASLLSRVLAAHPERDDVPLASFWRLPDDADTALFTHGWDARELEHPRDLAIAALRATLGRRGLAESDQAAVAAALHDVLTDAPVVYARGSDVVAIQKALVAFQSAKEGPAKEQAARAAIEPYLGYWVFGFDEPPARLTGVFKAIVAAWNRPAIRRWLKAHVEGVPPPSLLALPATGLPAGSSHVELAVFVPSEDAAQDGAAASGAATGSGAPRKTKAAPPMALTLHAVVVPDPGRTWLVLAADDKLALSKARGLLAAAAPGAPGTLATHPRLERLRERRGTGGGFTSLRAWVALSPEPSAEAPAGRAGDPLALLASLPSQGLTPITFSTRALPEQGDDVAGGFEGSVYVPRPAIEDILLFAVQSGRKI